MPYAMPCLTRRVSLNFRPKTACGPETEQVHFNPSQSSGKQRKFSASKVSLDGSTLFNGYEEKILPEDSMVIEDDEPTKRNRKHSLQEHASQGFKGVMRRASVSAKSAWHAGTGKRKNRDHHGKDCRDPLRQSNNLGNGQSMFASGVRRFAPGGSNSLSTADIMPKWKRQSNLKGNNTKHDSSVRMPPPNMDHGLISPTSSQSPSTPMSPIVPSGGDAARAAAAAATRNEIESEALYHAALARHDTKSSRSLASALEKDNESGVCINMDTSDDAAINVDVELLESLSTMSRRDFIKDLPPELAEHVLACLPAGTLAKIELVNKFWRDAARSRHVWRHKFLEAYGQVPYPVQAPLLPIGSLGLGKKEPEKDWRLMYKARIAIEHNWRNGNGSAIYLSGHTDSVYCVQFDDKKLITGSRDRTIRVWDLHQYKCLKVVGGPSSKPTEPHKYQKTIDGYTVHKAPCVNGTPYGDAIFHAPRDFHSASVLCLQYDSEIMVTGSSDNTCIVWDIKTFQPIRRLFRHSAGVLDICFDEKHIISCSKDATIIVWDRHTGAVVRTLMGHRGPVNAVQLRGHLLVSASGDGVARLWNIKEGHCIREFASRDRGLAAVEFSDDAKYVLAGGNDQVVYKFDANTGQLVGTYKGHEALVRSLFLDSRNNRIISGSYDLSLRVYDFEKGEEVATFPQWTTSWMLSAKSDYRRIVSTSQDGRILIVDFGYGVEGADLLEDSGMVEGFDDAKIAMRRYPVQGRW